MKKLARDVVGLEFDWKCGQQVEVELVDIDAPVAVAPEPGAVLGQEEKLDEPAAVLVGPPPEC